jgi:hypothetical protein
MTGRPDTFRSVLRITAGQVRDHYRIPVILGRRGPQYLSAVVAIELWIRGTFLGPFETPAGVIWPTGAKLDIPAADFWYMRDGKTRSSTAISVRPPYSRSWAYCRTSPLQSASAPAR